MVNCPCGFGKNLTRDQKNCPVCGTDLTPLHFLEEIPEIYYREGIRILEQGEVDKAIEMLMTSILLNYNSSAPYVVLGDIFTQKGLYGEAIRKYDKALEIDPSNEEAKRKKDEAEKLQKKRNQQVVLYKIVTVVSIIVIFLMVFTSLFLWQNLQKKNEQYSNLEDKFKDLVKKHETLRIERKPAQFLYTVKYGDNLSSIAYRFYGNQNMWWKIYEANKDKIKDPMKIYKGQSLSIPILQQ
jgi:tetratricopeptide (TPR) repeat protein